MQMRNCLALFLATLGFATAKKYDTKFKGFSADLLNVHVVSHTHDDVGWLKTVDEYYMGANNSIQHAGVQYILDSVFLSLKANPDRKFIYVEQAFFQRWYSQQDPDTQQAVQQLVTSGQLEFINGGWCMHDEATTSYIDMIDQTTLGHRLIKQQFGVVPKTTWQIDPFGHSASQNSLLTALSGFNGLYFARMDYQDRENRMAANTLEFIWRSSKNFGANAQAFTGLLYSGYGPPGPFCFDLFCAPIPVQDDPNLFDYNVQWLVDTFVDVTLGDQANHYLGNHIMLTMGSDFEYENANEWYKNLDKLIHYVNLDGRVNAFYSTPSIYTAAKLSQNITWTVKTDDFFPYADGPHAYWTGYFTSRPGVKGYVRASSSYQQAARQIQLFVGGAPDMGPDNPLYLLERAMGVAQHHDAVSGTEKQHVAYDYAKRISIGRTTAGAFVSQAFGKLTQYQSQPFTECDLTNVTICETLEAGSAQAVLVYNPQGQAKAAMPVRLSAGFPSGVNSYSVADNQGNPVVAQIVPLSSADQALRAMYAGSATKVQWLHFIANVPAAGYAVYFITPSASEEGAPLTHISKVQTIPLGQGVEDTIMTNGLVTITISSATGMISNYKSAAVTTPLTQQWLWYNSSVGNSTDTQASGAYIFRPNSSTPFPASGSGATVEIVQGPIVNETRQTVASWITQVTRLVAKLTYVEFEFTVGHVDVSDKWGHEVITRYTSGFSTSQTWYTDSNGREMQTRVYNYRPTWNLTVVEPVAGNYYPVNFAIQAKDANSGNTMTVLTDRSEGGASLVDGSVEIMVHRRILHDDGRGVGEPLNEPGIDGQGLTVRSVHRLFIDTAAAAPVNFKTGLQDLKLRPVVVNAPVSIPPSQWISTYTATFSGLSAPLPPNVELLTAHSQGPNTVLLRLSHLYEVGEDPTMSQNVTVSIANMFSGITITAAQEYDLVASTPLTELDRFTLRGDDGSVTEHPYIPPAPQGKDIQVTLTPMQIRTFIVTTQ